MAITSYTTYDDVRAVLGVTDNELTDATLGLSVYDMNLQTELVDVGPSLPSVFATVDALDPSTQSDIQAAFVTATKLFATYAVAKQLGSALPMFSPKEMTDGKSMMQRFGTNPYQDTLARIDKAFNRNLDRLVKAYGAVNAALVDTPLRTFMLSGSPSSDRVTVG